MSHRIVGKFGMEIRYSVQFHVTLSKGYQSVSLNRFLLPLPITNKLVLFSTGKHLPNKFVHVVVDRTKRYSFRSLIILSRFRGAGR